MELPDVVELVTEFGLECGGREYPQRFYLDPSSGRWFAELAPLHLAEVDGQGIGRFVGACVRVVEEGAFEVEEKFFDDGYVSGTVLVSADTDDASRVFLAVDLDVDFKQDLSGHDANGRPRYHNPRTVSFAPTCRFESEQDRDRLMAGVYALRERVGRQPRNTPG